MTRPLLTHILWMILGYAIAVLAATCVTVIALRYPTNLIKPGKILDFSDLRSMFIFGLLATGPYAFPGWLISMITAEIRNERRGLYFAIAGLVTASVAVLLFGASAPDMASGLRFIVTCLIGGVLGGLVYWRTVGRNTAQWKQPHDAETTA